MCFLNLKIPKVLIGCVVKLSVSLISPSQVIPPLEDMLGIELLEIHFPFELDQQISHSIELSNDTDGYIAFMNHDKGKATPLLHRAKQGHCPTTIQVQCHHKNASTGRQTAKWSLQEKDHPAEHQGRGALAAMNGGGDIFIGKDRNVVDKVNVMVVFDTPPSAEESWKDV